MVLQAGIVHTIDFFADTKPNHILINNLSPSKLYMAPNGIPSPQIYDKEVSPFGESLYAQDTGIKRFQLYVDGTGSSRIKFTTFEADFNPTAIAGSTVNGASGGGGGAGDGSVTIVGHSVPLPAGSNNIGKVAVTSMPQQTFTLDTLPPGVNNIGKVDVNTLPPLATGTSHIGSVGVDGSVSISTMPNVNIATMPPVEVTSEPTRSKHHAYEGSIGVSEVVWDLTAAGTLDEDIVEINYISNDDPDNDLFVSFDDVTATITPGQGRDSVFRLKAGETLSNFNRQCVKIRFIRAAGSGNVRVLGV
jgi:hypothetical protein